MRDFGRIKREAQTSSWMILAFHTLVDVALVEVVLVDVLVDVDGIYKNTEY